MPRGFALPRSIWSKSNPMQASQIIFAEDKGPSSKDVRGARARPPIRTAMNSRALELGEVPVQPL